ncbi:MAG TPA: hypothetical protein VK601_10220 [Kofleriaceae bacterium]|nr:hypothetical protein [Kofleriaceae bacterium]
MAARPRDWRPAHVAVAVVVALCAAGGAGRAQSGSAGALNDEGYRLLDEGKIAEACEAFEASNRVQPGAGAYLGLGQCRERNHQLASAWSAYQKAQTRAHEAPKRAFASARITALEPRLSYLTVTVSETSCAAGVTITRNGTRLDPRLWNRPLPIDGGDYVIEVRTAGREPRQIQVHVPEERGQVTAAVPDLECAAVPLPPPPPPGWTLRRKLAVGSFAAGAAAAVTGTALGLWAKRDHDRSDELCPEVSCISSAQATSLSRSAHNLSIGADVAFGIAGAAVITGAILWFTGERQASNGAAAPPAVTIAPAVSPGRFAVTAAWSF